MTRDQAKAAITQAALDHVGAAFAILLDSASQETKGTAGARERVTVAVAEVLAAERVMHEIVDAAFVRDAASPSRRESDDAYRERLRKIIGDGSVNAARLETAAGTVLDELGSFYDLLRR